MNSTPLVTLVLLCLTSVTESSCPDGWTHHGSTCYHFSHDTESMPIASLICKHMGGTLTEIESSVENFYIAAQATLYQQSYWIGLSDVKEEGIWMWYDSDRLLYSTNFTDWATNQPDNRGGYENCVAVDRYGHWSDNSCHNSMHYICEKPDEAASIVGKRSKRSKRD